MQSVSARRKSPRACQSQVVDVNAGSRPAEFSAKPALDPLKVSHLRESLAVSPLELTQCLVNIGPDASLAIVSRPQRRVEACPSRRSDDSGQNDLSVALSSLHWRWREVAPGILKRRPRSPWSLRLAARRRLNGKPWHLSLMVRLFFLFSHILKRMVLVT